MKNATARLAGLDLNLLVVLRELLRQRHVTRAADRVGVSQPAASAALARLRRHFDDELLVRRGGRYELSPVGEQLAEQVETVCDGIEALFATGGGFEPATTRREFRMVLPDHTIALMGGELAAALHGGAPHARLHLMLARAALTSTIEDTIHTVDGVVSQPTARFRMPEMRSARLYRDRWVCVAAADNERFGRDVVDLDALAGATWVVPYHDDTDFPSVVPVSRELARLGLRPRVTVRVDSFQAVPHLVAASGHVALVQERLALACGLPLRLLDCPGPGGRFEARLWWHARNDDDPAHRWFRELVVRVARGTVPDRGGSAPG
ncbi:LysR family transcriptional regulator [Pseudonocardia endophytica]|uniref:DNA-binding transcriptional LysR family regulator n=1 Tax=Pseudonocardia endophytica TaxID=401976 RepID=A0A4R1HUL5_PSEEN|nr:LysR family transcriptional regulator [Pseudonocardia endophytica]TCK24340.1 DNA-binding transcriptional LysR family regulator [Pseudonocardia endophytica]